LAAFLDVEVSHADRKDQHGQDGDSDQQDEDHPRIQRSAFSRSSSPLLQSSVKAPATYVASTQPAPNAKRTGFGNIDLLRRSFMLNHHPGVPWHRAPAKHKAEDFKR
jgi:hypothetical protein